MSYLLFTPRYTRALLEIGYHDAETRIDEIEEFLFASSDGTSRPNGDSTAKSRLERRR
jgi:hypothetical protein